MDRALHDQQIVQIGQNMLDRDATGRFSADPCGQNELALPKAERAAARHAGEDRDVEDPDRDDCIHRACAKKRGDQYRNHQRGKGKDQIIAPHDELVQPAALPCAGCQPEGHAKPNANAHGHQCHRQ